MKHVDEFEKLFKVKFPVKEHVDYYVDTLSKSNEYGHLRELIEEFEQYEKDVEEMGYSSPRSYKLDHILPKMKQHILGTYAYGQLQGQTFSSEKPRKKDILAENYHKYLISIDFKEANFSALRCYDEAGELGKSLDDLCKKMDVHPTLAKSKSFREYVFGNTNPKRLQKVQHINTLSIIKILQDNAGLKEEDVVFISEDEFVVRLHDNAKLANDHGAQLFAAVEQIIDAGLVLPMPVHYKIYVNKPISKKMRYQHVYELGLGTLKKRFKTLHGVPGPKYMKYFKQYVLEQPLDRRDLMFMNDGEIAIWAEDDDSIVETIIPDGEITLQEAKSDYGLWFDRLKNEVPGLRDSQVRKIIDISIQLCKNCRNEDADKCHCWKY